MLDKEVHRHLLQLQELPPQSLKYTNSLLKKKVKVVMVVTEVMEVKVDIKAVHKDMVVSTVVLTVVPTVEQAKTSRSQSLIFKFLNFPNLKEFLEIFQRSLCL